MKGIDAFRLQVTALFSGDGRGDETPGIRIVVEAFEQLCHPRWYGRAAHRAEFHDLGKIRHRQNTGHYFDVDPCFFDAVNKVDINAGIEKILRYRACRTGIQFPFEVIEVVGRTAGDGCTSG